MPTKTFDEKTLGDLSLLAGLPETAAGEFARIAVDFTLNGARPKMFVRAAGALQVETATVSNCVAAISRTFMDCAKDNLTTREFATSVAPAELPEAAVEALGAAYKAAASEMRERAREGAAQLPSFRAFDWRLDLEMSRRAAHHTVQPKYVIRVDTVQPAAASSAGGSAAAPSTAPVQSVYMESDFATLKRLQSALHDALAEGTTQHASRVQRYVR